MNLDPDTPLEEIFRLTPAHKQALRKLQLTSARDLLYHFPVRYQSAGVAHAVSELISGENAIVSGTLAKIEALKTFRRKVPATKAVLRDESGALSVTWLHQPYLATMLREGTKVRLTGKVTTQGGRPTMFNPEVERADADTMQSDADLRGPNANTTQAVRGQNADTPLFPVYAESRGVSSRWMFYAVHKLLERGVLALLEDPLPKELLHRYHLPALDAALRYIHAPKSERHSIAARKRFAFEEVFLIQLARLGERQTLDALPSFRIEKTLSDLAGFLSRLPFELTEAQKRAIEAVLRDFESGHPMSRLLEGDVGSGKTAVAAATAYAIVTTRPRRPAAREELGAAKLASAEGYDGAKQDFGNLQVAYMAPTEILAKQHFATFIELFSHLPIHIGLITSSGCKKFPSKTRPDEATAISRVQLLRWVASGEIAILIGTHALIQKSVLFKHLAYVIIDEQHRFGVSQRAALVRRHTQTERRISQKQIAAEVSALSPHQSASIPHLLSMTATPIPRTLALTIYGDLDLTLLDEMPHGRKPVLTEILVAAQRERAYERMRSELARGRQCYVICPRIDEPDPEKELALQAKSVKEEAARLSRDVFPRQKIEVLHGALTPAVREATMQRFAAGEVHILVATSVVEVGVNVPNTTVILIEGSERFGLAQLHQLRGRVLRSTDQAYCFALTESRSKLVAERLRALKTAKNGFELAELDLKIRGPGELSGARQWGLSDVGMEALKNIKMVEAARTEAARLIREDPELERHPSLRALAESRQTAIHFE
ncbi:MAG: ATP-dependent DNA helicase RecG [bacterium]|nr:ATP-dependent DNA helicase RecG [bacterium]MDZ4284690.1 ATP-dependent DNA helicase RecG [Patescibacteria group bacterium]